MERIKHSIYTIQWRAFNFIYLVPEQLDPVCLSVHLPVDPSVSPKFLSQILNVAVQLLLVHYESDWNTIHFQI